MGEDHPSIWKFIVQINLEQSLADQRILRMIVGQRIPRLYEEVKARDKKLKKKVVEYQNTDSADTLELIFYISTSHCILETPFYFSVFSHDHVITTTQTYKIVFLQFYFINNNKNGLINY